MERQHEYFAVDVLPDSNGFYVSNTEITVRPVMCIELDLDS